MNVYVVNIVYIWTVSKKSHRQDFLNAKCRSPKENPDLCVNYLGLLKYASAVNFRV